MMKRRHFLLLSLASGLVACGDDQQAQAANTADTSSGEELAEQLRQAEIPTDTPKIGTAIKDVVKPVAEKEVVSESENTTQEIMWEDLVPESFQPKKIMQKYQAEIQSVEEGSSEERALLKKIMAEFDNAPTNEKLSGKKVKIPGFVTPLDQSGGMVGEFLLVPTLGSCVHSPPPPINQTILVKPAEGQSISLDQIYNPVWVTGNMKVESIETTLAQAGYVIEDARLEEYT